MKKIAVIGSGISGLTCAHYLQNKHQVTVFEANDYIGGHTATKEVAVEGETVNIDTGFIVFNDWTYPNFIRLMGELGVPSIPTEMGFSVSCDETGLEYSGGSVATLFAQKRNLFNLKHWRMIKDILRFNKVSKERLAKNDLDESVTIAQYLKQLGLSKQFAEKYLIPMGAAIWSSGLQDTEEFPALYFLRFFKNHGLLNVNERPQWSVIKNGSKTYVEALIKQAKFDIILNQPVTEVIKSTEGGESTSNILVNTTDGQWHFDEVIFACHSDQALRLIGDKSEAHQNVLGNLHYSDNEVVLHTDTRLLPSKKSTWSSWNYRIRKGLKNQPTLTYDMNILQCLTSDIRYCVTLNDTAAIEKDKIIGTYHYSHPMYTHGTLAAQAARDSINGVDNMWFCGAYWYAGFHEDGVRSALDVVNRLGEHIDIL